MNRDFKIPQAEIFTSTDGLFKAVHDELQHNCEILEQQIQQEYPKVTEEQKNVFHAILKSVKAQKGQVFVLDASGGTRKTYTINLILAAIRSKKKIAIATAFSGIAATLLSHGRTLHSRCTLPLQIHETSMCNIFPQDATGVLFKKNRSPHY